jgi:hypothetical protein
VKAQIMEPVVSIVLFRTSPSVQIFSSAPCS